MEFVEDFIYFPKAKEFSIFDKVRAKIKVAPFTAYSV